MRKLIGGLAISWGSASQMKPWERASRVKRFIGRPKKALLRSESKASATKAPSRNGNQQHIMVMTQTFSSYKE